jgi:hypothetical protein
VRSWIRHQQSDAEDDGDEVPQTRRQNHFIKKWCYFL